MKTTREELENEIQKNYTRIEKLENELNEVCCYPYSLYAKKIKAEQIFFNNYLQNSDDKNGRLLDNQNKQPMRRLFNVIFNHEIWKRCNHCKIEFDQRFYKTYCPNCNKEN